MPENPYLNYLEGLGDNNYESPQDGPMYADWATTNIDDERPERTNSMMYELVGAGLWSFFDEAAFGVPGMVGGEDLYQKMAPQTFAGELSAGIGGIAGFALGAPMKAGRKAMTYVAKPFVNQLVKSGGEKFVLGTAAQISKKSVRKAIDEGLSREIAGDIGQQYLNVARKGQLGTDVADVFARKSNQVIDEVVGDYAAKGLINKAEIDIIQNTLKKDLAKRPISNFKELYLAKGDPTKSKYMGWMADEIITFATIDTFREGLHTQINQNVHDMDYSYNWTEPLWGGAIGMGFGMLHWMKPIGKSASFKNDFVDGVKGAFRVPLKGKTLSQVMTRSKNLGSMLSKSKEVGDEVYKEVTYNNKKYMLDLINPGKALTEYGDVIGEAVIRKGLNENIYKQGMKLAGWAVKEEAQSLQKNWFRMAMGGTIFNARSIFDIAANDSDITVRDMLPTFLIGAFLQRKGTPKDWDINETTNNIRKNLHVMGVNTRNLIDIPSFNAYQGLHMNPISHNETLKEARDMARKLNIISDNYDLTVKDIPEGDRSVLVADQATGSYDVFNSFYKLLIGQDKQVKDLHNIPSKDADAVQDIIKKADWTGIEGGKIITTQDAFKTFDAINKSASTMYERNMKTTLSEIKEIKELDIRTELLIDELHMGEFPSSIIASTIRGEDGQLSLVEAAMDGNLIKGFKGVEARNMMNSTINKANAIITDFMGMGALTPITPDPNTPNKQFTIKTMEGYDQLKLVVDRFESNINSAIDHNSSFKFDINKHLEDVSKVIHSNRAKESAKLISELVSPRHQDYQVLAAKMREAGLLRVDKNGVDSLIPHAGQDMYKILGGDADNVNERLFIKNFLDIAGARGDYDGYKYSGAIEVDISAIKDLQSYLGKQGMMTRGPAMSKWSSFTTNYIMQDVIRSSNMNSNDLEALTALRSIDEVGIVSRSSGQNRPFKIVKFDAPVDKTSDLNLKVSRYNAWADELSKRSESDRGRLVIIGDELIPVHKGVLDIIDQTLDYAEVDHQFNTRRLLADFMTTGNQEHAQFKNTLDNVLTANPSYGKHIVRMLETYDIIKSDRSEGYISYKFNTDGLSETIIKDGKEYTKMGLILYEMDNLGMSFNTVDAQMTAANIEVADMIASSYEAPHDFAGLTQDQFFSKFFTVKGTRGETPLYADAPTQAVALTDIANRFNLESRAVDIDENFMQNFIAKNMRTVDANHTRISKFDFTKNDHIVAFDEAKDHLTSLLTTRAGSSNRLLVQFENGTPVARRVRMQNTKFLDLVTTLGIDPIFASGSVDVIDFDNHGQYQKRHFSMFDAETKYLSGREKEVLKSMQESFDTSLNSRSVIPVREYGTDLSDSDAFASEMTSNGVMKGSRIFRIAESVPPMIVKNHQLSRIAEAYKDLMDAYKPEFDKDTKLGVHWQDMQKRYDAMVKSNDVKIDQHELALRTLVYERFVAGKGRKNPKDMMPYITQDLTVEDLTKRLNLMHTPNFKKGVPEITQFTGRSKKDKDIINKFLSRGKVRVNAWDDDYNSVKASVRPYFDSQIEFDNFWQKELHGRADVSGYDSITYVSRDYMRYLQLEQGRAANEGTELFKPVIQSDGDVVLHGKTVFVYERHLDNYFSKSGADMLITKSAMKNMDSGWHADKGTLLADADAMKDVKYREIDLSDVVIKQDRVHNKDKAKLSVTSYNYLSTLEANNIFGDFYGQKLKNALDSYRSLIKDPQKRQAFFNSETFFDQSMETMVSSGSGATQALGASKVYSQFADPSHLNEKMVKSQFYRKLIDPIINQSAVLGDKRFGGKAVLIQSLDPKLEAKPTLYQDGKIKQYGTIFVPHYERQSKISNFIGGKKDFEVRILDTKDNKVLDLKDVYKDDAYDLMVNKELGEFHDILKADYNGTYKVAMISTRYPSTRPNDKMILGLEDFLHKDYGNAMITSKMDVLNIFEGDYDVDKNDYFWVHSKTMFDHIQKVNASSFMQGIDAKKFAGTTDNLYLTGGSSLTDKSLNQNFITAMANNSAFSGNIGVVQKIPRALTWLADKASKTYRDTGQRILLESKGHDGNPNSKWVVTMDYDNNNWRHRAVTEGQGIIDAGNELDGSLFSMKKDYRYRLLYQPMDMTIPHELIAKDIGFIKKMTENKHEKRPRLFRRYNLETKQEDNLTEFDISNIDAVLQNYNKLLNLGTDVYDAQGKSKKPSYDDIIDYSDNFFSSIENIQWSVFNKVNKQYKDTHFMRQYNPVDKLLKSSKWKTKDTLEDTDFYKSPTDSPFEDGLVANMKQSAKSGDHGMVFDRLMWNIREADPGRNRSYEGLTGDAITMMEQSLLRLADDPKYFSEFSANVMNYVRTANDGLSTMKFLTKKWGSIDKLEISTKRKMELKDQINEQLDALKEKNSELLKANPAYNKQPSVKNLQDSFIKIVPMDGKQDLLTANAEFSTADEFVKLDHGSPGTFKDIDILKQFERRAYGDLNTISTTLKYDARTISDTRIKQWLARMPSQGTVEQVIEMSLTKGVKDHGLSFLFHYASQKASSNQVGIFGGNVVAMPHKPSKRFQRVLRWMSKNAVDDPDINNALKIVAERRQFWGNHFDKNHSLNSAEPVTANIGGTDISLRHFKGPDFGTHLASSFDSYRAYQWKRQVKPIDNFKLAHEESLSFYKAFFNLFGQGADFDAYIGQQSQLRKSIQSTGIYNPMSYLASIANMDADIHKFANKNITGAKDMTPKFWSIEGIAGAREALRGNRLYALLGGDKHFKGLSFAFPATLDTYDIQSMKEYGKQSVKILKGEISDGPAKRVFEEYNLCKK